MGVGVETGEGGQSGRLEGALKLLNALIGIRLRNVSDPESRRHLIWLNDIVSALGLWNRRTAHGRAVDFGDYLDEAVTFWSRTAVRVKVALRRPSGAVLINDVSAAGLAIVAHDLIGAAFARLRPDEGDCRIILSLENGAEGLRLTVADEGPASEGRLTPESLDLIRGLAEHLGGRLYMPRPSARAATVVLPPQEGPELRH